MSSELWQRIRCARHYANMTQQQLAAALVVSREAVSQWESADPAKRTNPTVKNLRKIALVTNCPIEWISETSGNLALNDCIKAPGGTMRAVVCSGVGVYTHDVADTGGDAASNECFVVIGGLSFKRESLEVRGLDYNNLATMHVDGDGMSPGLRDGGVVMYDKSKTVARHGEVYVVRLDDELMIKRLHKMAEGLNLVSDNPVDPRNAPRAVRKDCLSELQIIGQVVWSASWHGR